MRPLYYELRLQYKTPARQILLVCLAGVKWFRSKALILILVEEEIFFGGLVRPDVFDAVVDITLILYLL